MSLIGLGSTPDGVIGDYAKEHGFAFLTKDKDFANLSLAPGSTAEGDFAADRKLLGDRTREGDSQQRGPVFRFRE